MSCEVIPAGLSQSSSAPSAPATPSPTELSADLAAEQLDELVPLQVGRDPGSPPVAAAALAAGDCRDVDVAAARAQADLAGLAAAGALIADQRCDLGALDRAQVVDDALGHLLPRPGRLVVGRGDVGEDEVAIAVALDPVQRT